MRVDAWAKLGLSWTEVGLVVASAAGIYFAMVACSRLFGARQFSRTTGYDFAFVFGLGSVIGRVVLVRPTLLAGIVGLLTLFTLHALFELAHHRISGIHRLVQNRPVLLVAHGEVLHDNLRAAHVGIVELRQQLRQGGHGSLRHIEAVILERSGAYSILAGDRPVDPAFLEGVVDGTVLR